MHVRNVTDTGTDATIIAGRRGPLPPLLFTRKNKRWQPSPVPGKVGTSVAAETRNEISTVSVQTSVSFNLFFPPFLG